MTYWKLNRLAHWMLNDCPWSVRYSRICSFYCIHYWRQEVIHELLRHFRFLFLWHLKQEKGVPKCQIISKWFLVSSISSKNEQKNSSLLLWYLRLTCFLKEIESKTPKNHFEIIWPLHRCIRTLKIAKFCQHTSCWMPLNRTTDKRTDAWSRPSCI